LQEDRPREDGAACRPLAFDEDMRRKPAYQAIAASLSGAPRRGPLWPISS
jgi:endo-1,4-beta-xylanase